MSLPFLMKPRASGGVITEVRPSDHKDDSDNSGLEMAAKDLCEALEVKDFKRISAALKAAFQILDAMPHDEGEHLNEQSEE